MNPPSIMVDSIHSEIISRTPIQQPVKIGLKINFDKPTREKNTLMVRFKLIKDTTMVRTTITGQITVTSDSGEELDNLEKTFRNPNQPPMGLIEYIILKLQPLILLAEDYMGAPPLPVLPVPPNQQQQPVKTDELPIYQ